MSQASTALQQEVGQHQQDLSPLEVRRSNSQQSSSYAVDSAADNVRERPADRLPSLLTSELVRPVQRPQASICTFASRALLVRLAPGQEEPAWAHYLPRTLRDQRIAGVLRRSEIISPPVSGSGCGSGGNADASSSQDSESTTCLSGASRMPSPTSRSELGDIPLDDAEGGRVFVNLGGRLARSRAGSAASQLGRLSETEAAACNNLAGRVWFLAQDPEGSREVQRVMETVDNEFARTSITLELVGRIPKAIKCPHANHVVQKCIELCRPETLQFMVDEIIDRPILIRQCARHRYACRAIQALLKYCRPDQVSGLIDMLLDDALVYSVHSFGSYVMQQVAAVCSDAQQYRLLRILERSAETTVPTAAWAGVVAAVLRHADKNDGKWLARSLAANPDMLLNMCRVRNGHASCLLALERLPQPERDACIEALRPHQNELHGHRAGLLVLANVDLVPVEVDEDAADAETSL